MPGRRSVLRGLLSVPGGALLAPSRAESALAPPVSTAPPILKPGRLRPGDTVALVCPATATFEPVELDLAVELVKALELRPRLGPNVEKRRGYLAGSDRERAEDVNAAFADPDVRAIFAVRGGWGCARLLPLLDYAVITRRPKILLGYSDVTALLLGIHARTGLVTFHGPTALDAWSTATLDYARRLLFDGEAVTFENLRKPDDRLVPRRYRTRTVTPGKTKGRLLGGNLTVLCHLLGSPYLPEWKDAVLLLEDVNETPYRIDRMLTHLKLAGVLEKTAAVVFGGCTECGPGEGYGSLTLDEILADHVRPLGVPAWQGAMFGHLDDQFTLPEGVLAEADADRATLRLLEPAVA